ncbi:hypothetical protein AXG93_392s1160 [Marchantia polymorpha subsp. ruderalis]|uniref:Uncharacterized protein n=1 Tax=Marchantia polymorpha subsp. ruderalis TaxID=1480154 RepID=A0A176WQ91_MARPO|nr:hypothetical protein AXG93_392s1160 [Marchantia polymorpha subsp. ruderalis]
MDNGAAKPEISSGGGGGGWRGHRILGAGPEVTEGGDAPSGRKARPTDGGRLRIQAGRGRRRGLFAREQQPIQAQWHPPDASISSRDAASGRARGRQRAENGRRGTGQGQGEGTATALPKEPTGRRLTDSEFALSIREEAAQRDGKGRAERERESRASIPFHSSFHPALPAHST